MLRRPRALLVLVLAALALAGCRVDTTVRVQADERGAGTVDVRVVLDADAVAHLGTNPWQQLKVEDARAAGWALEGPTVDGDRTVFHARKAFAAPSALPAVMAEVFGTDGLVANAGLVRQRDFGRTKWTFTATIDPSRGPQALSDAQVTALVGGQPLGRSLDALQQESGTSLTDAAHLTLAVSLPGEVSSNAVTADGGAPAWSATFANAPVAIVASGTTTDASARLWIAVAAVAVGLLVLLLIWRLLRRGVRRGGVQRIAIPHEAGAVPAEKLLGAETLVLVPETAPESGLETAANPRPDASSVFAEAAPDPTTVPRARAVDAVVLHDSVLFEPGASLHDVLGPFVAARGGPADAALVAASREALDEGRIDTRRFWSSLGLTDPVDELDAALVERLMVSGDLAPMAARLASRDVRLAVFADGPATWFSLMRARFGLDAAVGTWIVSSEVRAHTPDLAAFAAIEFLVQRPFARCLYVDDDPTRLDAAAALGMRAVHLRRDEAHAGPDVDTRTITRLLDLVQA
jgi:beta-phosphoglucomutase-like phosphatase (HAD superfamily)